MQQSEIRYTLNNLVHYVDLLSPEKMFRTMYIASLGVAIAIQAIFLGGHLRIGLVDNLKYRDGLVQRVMLIF